MDLGETGGKQSESTRTGSERAGRVAGTRPFMCGDECGRRIKCWAARSACVDTYHCAFDAQCSANWPSLEVATPPAAHSVHE